jgi:hypothetical protein
LDKSTSTTTSGGGPQGAALERRRIERLEGEPEFVGDHIGHVVQDTGVKFVLSEGDTA